MTAAAGYQLRDLIERLERYDRFMTDEAAEVLRRFLENGGGPVTESPTFICEFCDGTMTRMTVATSLKKLDIERGVRLARCAYFSRCHEAPPAIKAARFEKDGALLESYSAVDLEDIEERPIEDIDVKAMHAERDAVRRSELLADAAEDAEDSTVHQDAERAGERAREKYRGEDGRVTERDYYDQEEPPPL